MSARASGRAQDADALAAYRQKRNFSLTEEPKGAAGAQHSRIFVVQKHAASHLHYDFRLELDGILLSWAVPKEPSLDPKIKRLALEVEPHPLEYASFEGTIPKGQYGGGTVMVWDHGDWTPEGDARAGLKKGHLSFNLSGTKLHGKWHLVRTPSKSEKPSWLLFKANDEFAQVGSKVWAAAAARDGTADVRTTQAKRAVPPSRASIPGATAVPLPALIEPELATLVDRAPEGPDFIHEIKLDGYRLLVRRHQSTVQIFSRNGLDWTERLPQLVASVQALPAESLWMDGELVALNPQGVSDFQLLQNSLKGRDEQNLVYFAFDLPYANGQDLRGCSLLERKSALRALLPSTGRDSSQIIYSDHVVGKGPELFAKACESKLEGIISKRALSSYRSGRSRDWLKVKCIKRQEFAIVGFTAPEGGRSHLGALLLAVRKGSEWVYSGKVGTGFNAASLKDISLRLKPLAVKKSSIKHGLTRAALKGVTWVKPSLVAEVSFVGITTDGRLRHPTFVGLREDKRADEVELELSTPTPTPIQTLTPPPPPRTPYPITHPDKVLYPEPGITKRELLDYYALVAERMLPHIARRPLTLVRCPNGQGRACFFQKHLGAGGPEGLQEVSAKDGNEPYPFLESPEGIFGLVQLGALEIHTWGSRVDNLERPDLLVFDLDPDETVDFAMVINAAKELRALFLTADLQSFVKTTGGKGLHVCVPVEPSLDWDEAKAFSSEIAHALSAQYPDRFVATQSKAKRRGKIFIDYLRNGRGATFVAPYSTRARVDAPIATPVEWDELTPNFRPERFTLRTMKKRVEEHPCPFAGMLALRQTLPRVDTRERPRTRKKT